MQLCTNCATNKYNVQKENKSQRDRQEMQREHTRRRKRNRIDIITEKPSTQQPFKINHNLKPHFSNLTQRKIHKTTQFDYVHIPNSILFPSWVFLKNIPTLLYQVG